jgi:hypothetical protein
MYCNSVLDTEPSANLDASIAALALISALIIVPSKIFPEVTAPVPIVATPVLVIVISPDRE